MSSLKARNAQLELAQQALEQLAGDVADLANAALEAADIGEALRPSHLHESIALVPPRDIKAYLADNSTPDLLYEYRHWRCLPETTGTDREFLTEFATLQLAKLWPELRHRRPAHRKHSTSHYPDAAEVKSRVSLVEVISRAVALTQVGNRYRGLCPFHEEGTPSFVVYADQGTYHCFGCGAHGDIYSWVMERQRISFPAAVEAVANV